MKLLSLKINTPFRSLPEGFEINFDTEGKNPYVIAGRNGSGKSNILEALAAIFCHVEAAVLKYLPDTFSYDEEENPKGYQSKHGVPDAFELSYEIKSIHRDNLTAGMNIMVPARVKVTITKHKDEAFIAYYSLKDQITTRLHYSDLPDYLPDHILGYSSGENEILSLPFFKMRFVHLDEYLQALKGNISYHGRPESRLTFLDEEFSQAILLSNFVMQDEKSLKILQQEVGLRSIKRFRIILNKQVELGYEEAIYYSKNYPKLVNTTSDNLDQQTYSYSILRPFEESANKIQDESVFLPLIERLKRCSTVHYEDSDNDCLILDYWVNDATLSAFKQNFSSALDLFQNLQVLLTLNLCKVKEKLKQDLYTSDSLYVNETVPSLPSDERVMRFKFVEFEKTEISQKVMLKNLSDGEHQLLHCMGLALLYRNSNCLFLLDEPETHFNPKWRSDFISNLNKCFQDSDGEREMLITTHSPFLISDSKPEKVLVFEKNEETGKVTVKKPDYNTFGSSINTITMKTFGEEDTIGAVAREKLEEFLKRHQNDEETEGLIKQMSYELGDSIEKAMIVHEIINHKNQ